MVVDQMQGLAQLIQKLAEHVHHQETSHAQVTANTADAAAPLVVL